MKKKVGENYNFFRGKWQIGRDQGRIAPIRLYSLKQLRSERNLSQQQTADAIGITRSAYSNYEQGLREPDLATLKKICLLFKVSADFLLDIEE